MPAVLTALRYMEQITLAATCAPAQDEFAAMSPATETKIVASWMVSDAEATASLSAFCDGPVALRHGVSTL